MIPQHDAHHVILGAGLIGCYLGCAFKYAKQSVTLIAKTHFYNQIKQQLAISDYTGNYIQLDELPEVVSAAAAISVEQDTSSQDSNKQYSNKLVERNNRQALDRPADVLWLTVKCLALDSVIPSITQCITPNTIIICCQNGVSNHVNIQHAFPNNHVIRAMVPFNVVNETAGVFHRGSQGHLVLESTADVADAIKWLARQINSPLLPTHTSHQMTALQWAKLQLNLGNAVNALADIPVKEMLENIHYRLFIAKLMRELLQVTEKKQIKLPKIANLPNKWIPTVLSLPNLIFTLVGQKMLAIDPKVRTSMWWDLQDEKPTEISFLNTKVVDVGQQIGVETPLNSALVKFIQQAENGDRITSEAFFTWVKEVNQKA